MEEDFSDSDTEFDYTSDETWSPLHESPNTSYNEESDDLIQEDEDGDEDEEFEIIEKTYFSEPFWGKVVNKN